MYPERQSKQEKSDFTCSIISCNTPIRHVQNILDMRQLELGFAIRRASFHLKLQNELWIFLKSFVIDEEEGTLPLQTAMTGEQAQNCHQ